MSLRAEVFETLVSWAEKKMLRRFSPDIQGYSK